MLMIVQTEPLRVTMIASPSDSIWTIAPEPGGRAGTHTTGHSTRCTSFIETRIEIEIEIEIEMS